MSKQISPISKEVVLKNALKTLNAFTEERALNEEKNGALAEKKSSPLKKIKNLAKICIASFLFPRIKQENKEELHDGKERLLKAIDNIQSYSALIQKYQTGTQEQRSLAQMALVSIERYNNWVVGSKVKQDEHLPIELPVPCVKKYHSHQPSSPEAAKFFEVIESFGKEFKEDKPQKSATHRHQKAEQFVIEAFQLKALRMIERHLKMAVAEILPFIKEAPPQIEESSADPKILRLKQQISLAAGSSIMITGSFKKEHSSLRPSTIPMPIAESFQLSSQFVHTGFPYPCQHNGWSLGWPEAFPLRKNKVPLFYALNEKRKALILRFLTDETFNQEVRRLVRQKRECFDLHRHFFVGKHRQLTFMLHEISEEELPSSQIDAFYTEAIKAPSAFDFLTYTQEKLIHLFIKEPLRALEEEWIENDITALRATESSQRLLAAKQLLLDKIKESECEWPDGHQEAGFLKRHGSLLGKVFAAISLQGQSEKMSLPPLKLSPLERRLQALAFEQQALFFEECQAVKMAVSQEEIKAFLESSWERALSLFSSERESAPCFAIASELEHYFHSRY